MTRLTNLEECVLLFGADCSLYLEGNAALPAELQQNVYAILDDTQALLQRIGAHYGGEHVLGF